MSKNNPKQSIYIGTKDEAFWTEILKSIEGDMNETERKLKYQKAVIQMCKNKILLEKRK